MCKGHSLKFRDSGKEFSRLYYSAVFLFVGLIAGAMNLAGVAAVATQSSWTLILSGVVLLAVHLMTRRTMRVS